MNRKIKPRDKYRKQVFALILEHYVELSQGQKHAQKIIITNKVYNYRQK